MTRTMSGVTRAGITVIAVAASFCATYAISHVVTRNTSPAILAAILTLSLARRPHAGHAMHWALYPFAVAAVGVVAACEGWLLHERPVLGAVAFVGGLFLSVWLRNFGARLRAIGTLVALPFVGMLVVPFARTPGSRGPLIDLGLVAVAGFIALAFSRSAGAIATRIPGGEPVEDFRARPRAASAAGFTPTTRMAIQMAVALALAFAFGFAVFRGHWAWGVLTAFIVCSGAVGRADAAWKALMRLGGALVGTASAALVTHVWTPSGPLEAVAIFAALFAGLALRNKNYAYWAGCMTLVFALLAHAETAVTPGALLVSRLEAVFAGALCAVAATWFVFPIRTVSVVRRRLADALLALDDFVATAHVSTEERRVCYAAYERRMHELERVAVPLRVHRRLLTIADHAEHPGRWIDLAHACHDGIRALDAAALEPKTRGTIRRAIGDARKAIGAFGNPHAAPADRAVSDSLRSLERTIVATGGAQPISFSR